MVQSENYFLDEEGEWMDDEEMETPGKVFSIFAYNPDWTDYCRGCEMGRGPSKFTWLCTNQKDEATEFLAEAFKEEYDEIIFLVDGVSVGDIRLDDYNQRESIYYIGGENKYVQEIVTPALEMGKQQKIEAVERAKAAEELERKKERELAERREKAEYDRLRHKWGKKDADEWRKERMGED